jgi:lipopolysaccharide assembly outer membrane protein LptD (OstA)
VFPFFTLEGEKQLNHSLGFDSLNAACDSIGFKITHLTLRRRLSLTNVYSKGLSRFSTLLFFRRFIRLDNHLLDFNISTRCDAYAISGFNNTYDSKKDEFKARFVPIAHAVWKYPLITKIYSWSWLLTPVTSLTLIPNIRQKKYPNEDARILEFDETNLFLSNRIQGIDRIDQGVRFSYGVNQQFQTKNNLINFFIGKATYLTHQRKQRENIIISTTAQTSLFRSRIRSSFDLKSKHVRFFESGIVFGKKQKLDIGYCFFQEENWQQQKENKQKIKRFSQIHWQFSIPIKRHWNFAYAQVIHLGRASYLDESTQSNMINFKRNKLLFHYMNISYEDECFKLQAGLYKSGYKSLSQKPDAGFLLKFSLKNLGDFEPIKTSIYKGSSLTQILSK